MVGVFFKQGEVCSAGGRILGAASIKDRFVARLVERARAMTIGRGLGDPDMGAMVSESQLQKVIGFVERAQSEGARLVCGGQRHVEGECAR